MGVFRTRLECTETFTYETKTFSLCAENKAAAKADYSDRNTACVVPEVTALPLYFSAEKKQCSDWRHWRNDTLQSTVFSAFLDMGGWEKSVWKEKAQKGCARCKEAI